MSTNVLNNKKNTYLFNVSVNKGLLEARTVSIVITGVKLEIKKNKY